MRAPLPRRPRNRSPALGHPSARAPFAWGGLQPPSCAAAAFARSAVARRGRPCIHVNGPRIWPKMVLAQRRKSTE